MKTSIYRRERAFIGNAKVTGVNIVDPF